MSDGKGTLKEALDDVQEQYKNMRDQQKEDNKTDRQKVLERLESLIEFIKGSFDKKYPPDYVIILEDVRSELEDIIDFLEKDEDE